MVKRYIGASLRVLRDENLVLIDVMSALYFSLENIYTIYIKNKPGSGFDPLEKTDQGPT